MTRKNKAIARVMAAGYIPAVLRHYPAYHSKKPSEAELLELEKAVDNLLSDDTEIQILKPL